MWISLFFLQQILLQLLCKFQTWVTVGESAFYPLPGLFVDWTESTDTFLPMPDGLGPCLAPMNRDNERE